MPSNEEDSDSHTGGNHHQRGITCSGKLVGSPCCPLSRGLRRFRNRCWKRARAANCTALHMKSERAFLFESVAATTTSGNCAVTATKGSSATAAAPYGRAPTFSPRIRPRTPGTPSNALAGGHGPVRELAQRRIGYATSQCRYQPPHYLRVRRRRFAHLRKLVLRVANNTLK